MQKILRIEHNKKTTEGHATLYCCKKNGLNPPPPPRQLMTTSLPYLLVFLLSVWQPESLFLTVSWRVGEGNSSDNKKLVSYLHILVP
jgi:hypothetical protein